MIGINSIVTRIRQLPTFSTILVRLSEVINDERSGSADLERVLRTDPALTANILRVANSAYFGCPWAIRSIGHALAMLGRDGVFRAAASASLAGVVPKRIPGYEIDALAFWQHSIAVAVLAERLAGELEIDHTEVVFTAGLLHDIGKLVIGLSLSEASHEVLDRVRGNDGAFVAAEREVLGTDHAEVGDALASHWQLPAEIRSAIRWHHDPAGARFDRTLVALVHVADGLAHMLGYGADVGELSRELDGSTLEILGLKVRTLEHVACEALDSVQELGELFNQTGGSSDGYQCSDRR